MDGNEIDDAALDRLLAQAPVPTVSSTLERRILGDFDRARSRWSFAKALRAAAEAVWPGGPVWQPAGAFAEGS